MALLRASRGAVSALKPTCSIIQVSNTHQFARCTARARQLSNSFRLATATKPEYVNTDRLMNDIHSTAQYGTGPKWGDHSTETGMSRLSLSDADKDVRLWFQKTCEDLGCKVTIDQMGNMFAVRPGMKDGVPTFAGSHLDTQPTGGRYDGILGVTAAIEMLRALQDKGIQTNYPVGVVNWTNEEGARFPISMVSSGVWAGDIPLEKAHNLASIMRGDSATMKSELERIGFLGETPASHEAMPLAAHFELHIEQGPILENEERKIGIVEGVQAYRWFTITVKGRGCHTGTTDLGSRSDALLAASKMIVAAREIAWREETLASVGIIEAKPGSTNTVPGLVTFSLDVRAKTDKDLKRTEDRLRGAFYDIAKGLSLIEAGKRTARQAHNDICDVEWRLDFESPAIKFHDDCIECVTEASRDVFGDEFDRMTKPMTSGAGHDSVYTNKQCPTSMIFATCRGGVSHNPDEYTPPDDCAIGAEVLTRAVLKYDELRAKRDGA